MKLLNRGYSMYISFFEPLQSSAILKVFNLQFLHRFEVI